MAFRKTLIQRVFHTPKISNASLTDCRVSSSLKHIYGHSNRAKIVDPDPGDVAGKISRRFLHKNASVTARSFPAGENLMKKLRSLDIVKDRIRLDGLVPPPRAEAESSPATGKGLSVEDAKKLLRLAQLETVKSRIMEIQKSWISKAEFFRVCGEACDDQEQGLRFAKVLDDSGTVIVLGSVVFLKPQQVAKVIGGLLPMPEVPIQANDPRLKELKKMEKQKAIIDKKADSLVRRELWCGLGFLVLQTAGFMRLTFWELTWDVMEPICFYVTSMYFMAGYTFFLRTSKEPSFEGFFNSRFASKQKRIMETENFDIDRYNELRRALVPSSSVSAHLFDSSERTLCAGIGH